MQTIAVLSHKGGSGKTTTTINWAVEAARNGQRVTILDQDLRQRSACLWATWRAERHPDAPKELTETTWLRSRMSSNNA